MFKVNTAVVIFLILFCFTSTSVFAVGVCEAGNVIVTLTKITPHGKVAYRICKGVELTYELIEDFCQDAVNPQKCKDKANAIIVGTGISVGTTIIATTSAMGATVGTAGAMMIGVTVAPLVVGGAIIGGVVGTIYWLFSDDETE